MPAPPGEPRAAAAVPRRIRYGAVVACLVAGLVAGTLVPKRIVGDGSTYILMATSLWFDRDLTYAPEDLARTRWLGASLVEPSLRLPAGLFLTKRDGAYRYAKPLAYPLVAAPFAAALGLRGFFILNGLAAAATVLLGACIVAQTLGWSPGLLVSAVAFTFSAAPVYVQWVDPFLLLTLFVAAGVAAYRLDRPALSGVFLAAVAATRFTYLPLLAAAPMIYVASGRWRKAIRFLAGALPALAALTLLTYLLIGQWSPYVGDRYWYPDPAAMPYAGPGAVRELFRGRAAFATRWVLPPWRELLLGAKFALLGRASGILLYFPTFIACAVWTRRLNREKIAWLATVAAVLLAFWLVIPHNPVGGIHALGNRFFVMLPIGLIMVDRPVRWSWRLAATAVLLLPALPLLASPERNTLEPGRMLLEWPHRVFPFEWTHAAAVPYPHLYPSKMCVFPAYCPMLGLTDTQSEWMAPGGVWALAGARTELVVIRPQERPARVRLSSIAAGTRVADGGVDVPMPQTPGAEITITLSHPRAAYRDESSEFMDLAVYDIAIEAPRAAAEVPNTAHPGGAVFVQPLP